MWDEAYDTDEYVFGTAPNDFLAQQYKHLQKGDILFLADGEGRNSVFLAGQGYHVTAVDNSTVGLKKAAALAKSKGVEVNYVHADLAEYDLGRACWDGVVVIFCHLPPELRAKVYRGIVNALKPGGLLLLECYGPGQMALGTGGPREEPLLLSADIVRRELAGLDFELLEEKHRPVVEGKRHSGQASVVQVLARRAIPAGNDGA